MMSLLLFMWGWSVSAQNVEKSKDLEKQVRAIDLPVVRVYTQDGVKPPSFTIKPIEGCMGLGTAGNSYVKGSMTITWGDKLLYDSGPYVKKVSGIRIKVRGNSSALVLRKPFKLKLQAPADLLGRGDEIYKDKEWALLNYFSTCDLRTVAGLYVGKLMGIAWEPSWQFVNLFVNDEYYGLYLLSETVEVSESRCQVDPTGFVCEADPYWWNEKPENAVIKTNHLPYAMGYTFKYPDYKANDPELLDLKAYMNALEDSLYAGKRIDEYMDLRSFATWMLAHDIMGTLDGAGANMFLMKNDFNRTDPLAGSKLGMGPLWDLGTIYSTSGKWATSHEMVFFYYYLLFRRPDFVEEYVRKWEEVKDEIYPKVKAFVQGIVSKYGKAIDASRKISPMESGYGRRSTAQDLEEVDEWYQERIPWMEEAIQELLVQLPVGNVEVGSSGYPNSRLSSLEIYDVNGKLCQRMSGDEVEGVLRKAVSGKSICSLSSGVYLLRVKYTDGSTETHKYVF